MWENLLLMLGCLLCTFALVPLFQWSASGLAELRHQRQQFEQSRKALQDFLARRGLHTGAFTPVDEAGRWSGFRNFVVKKLVPETDQCTSVYLTPADEKPITTFQPGQHLTFEFHIPGEAKPVVRCYSLSSAPRGDGYRITVKLSPAPADKPNCPPGKVSHFINRQLKVGDQVRVKAPSGSFVLDSNSQDPLILLAGGIGITPLLSMAEAELQRGSDRLILLIYGVRNSREHAFRGQLERLAAERENMHVVSVYSNPLPEDRQGEDYLVPGFVNIDILKTLLPQRQGQFYMCGPPPFMQSIYPALLDWGISDSQIFFEAFGPATIRRRSVAPSIKQDETDLAVTFSVAGNTVSWSGEHESILELAEASGIELESGCRAGSCGTCEIKLLKGKVSYPDGVDVDCAPGHCLACVAKPNSAIEVEA